MKKLLFLSLAIAVGLTGATVPACAMGRKDDQEGAREQMRATEGSVLLNGATAYMNVLRDTAILNLRKNNISVLEEQLRQTRDRFQVGEVTRTDVAHLLRRALPNR